MVESGWEPSVFRKGEKLLRLEKMDSPKGQPVEIAGRPAFLDRAEGQIGLPHLGLQFQINPKNEVDRLASTLAGSEGVTQKLGTSVQERPIVAHWFGHGPETVVFFGAFHGDEPESVTLLHKFMGYLKANPHLLEGRTAVFVPVVNPDGLAAATRKNARQVDLNRNFPTSNWNSEGKNTDYWGGPAPTSEPETRIVVDLLERFAPERIISVHCPYRCVNYDGPAEALAEAMAKANGYKVEPSIGYPTPGSFGTYAGIEGNIPTITLELPPTGEEDVWKQNRDALVRGLRGVEP
jgi:protein MpaA